MGQFEYDTIGIYTAILLIPYQVSIMSMFEYYRMNIPLFAPSLKLLTEWHMSWRCGTAKRCALRPNRSIPESPSHLPLQLRNGRGMELGGCL